MFEAIMRICSIINRLYDLGYVTEIFFTGAEGSSCYLKIKRQSKPIIDMDLQLIDSKVLITIETIGHEFFHKVEFEKFKKRPYIITLSSLEELLKSQVNSELIVLRNEIDEIDKEIKEE